MKQLEQQLGRPDPKAIQKATAEVLAVVIDHDQPVNLYTDDHPHYRTPIRDCGDQVTHYITPGKEHRDSRNKLWEVNLFDMFVRHSCKNHTRETIAFSKRRQASAERMAIFAVGRNYIMNRRQKDRRSPTPAMARGMLAEKLSINEVLGSRIFIGHHKLPKSWEDYYWHRVSTRALGGYERRHTLKYAV